MMKYMQAKWSVLLLAACLLLLLSGCVPSKADESSLSQGETALKQVMDGQDREEEKRMYTIKVTVRGQSLYGTLENNAATKALLKQFPLHLHMVNLYGREMTYRYGQGALPTEHLRADRYDVGDIVYWAPRGSFVILYQQNGEEFERQQLGHLNGDLSIFADGSDADVIIERVE